MKYFGYANFHGASKKMKRFLTSTLLLVFIFGIFSVFLAAPVYAQESQLEKDVSWTGLVPCGRNDDGTATAEEQKQCTLCHLVIGIQRLFSYGVSIIIAVALAAFFIAGIMYTVSGGNQEMMESSKKFMMTSMVGLAIVAGAWLIVNVSLWAISAKGADDPNGGGLGIERENWFSFTCNTDVTPYAGSLPVRDSEEGPFYACDGITCHPVEKTHQTSEKFTTSDCDGKCSGAVANNPDAVCNSSPAGTCMKSAQTQSWPIEFICEDENYRVIKNPTNRCDAGGSYVNYVCCTEKYAFLPGNCSSVDYIKSQCYDGVSPLFACPSGYNHHTNSDIDCPSSFYCCYKDIEEGKECSSPYNSVSDPKAFCMEENKDFFGTCPSGYTGERNGYNCADGLACCIPEYSE